MGKREVWAKIYTCPPKSGGRLIDQVLLDITDGWPKWVEYKGWEYIHDGKGNYLEVPF